MQASYVYLILNMQNNKIYVGVSRNPKRRWQKHKSIARSETSNRKYAIHHAIKKYGEASFVFKVIEKFTNEVNAYKREELWIAALKIEGYSLYNITEGGDRGPSMVWSDERKKEWSIKFSGKNNPCFGKRFARNLQPAVVKKIHDASREATRRLSDKQIQEIKILIKAPDASNSKIAALYGVGTTLISEIKNFKRWRNEDDPVYVKNKTLTLEDASKIRNMYSTGKYTQKEVAEKFQITDSNVEAIIVNRIHFDPNYTPYNKNKLKENLFKEIKNKYIAEGYSAKELAAIYNYSKSNIFLIINRK